MRVTAVVVSHNAARDLPACLDALLAQDHEPLEVLVIDNASTDGSREVLAAYADRVRLHLGSTNRGYAGAMNDALAASDADAVLACNPDVVAAPDLVRHLTNALGADDQRGAVQPKLVRRLARPDGTDVIDTTGHLAYRTRLFHNRGEGDPDDGRWDVPGAVFGVSGACALYRRATLDDIAVDGEVFAEDLFAYFEDVDLDWRAQLRGWSAWYEPRATGVHERGGAGPRRTRFVERLNYRNRLLTVIRNDDVASLSVAIVGVAVTSLLKSLELLVTSPRALAGATRDLLRLLPRAVSARRAIGARATVGRRAVVRRWFCPPDHRRWVRTWWRRVRGIPTGH